MIVAIGVVGLLGAAVGAAAPGRVVIGKPVAVPARAQAGKPFAVSFRVTRGGIPLRAGAMICDPSVSGVVVRHVESFKGGVARIALVLPDDASGVLKVSLTIRAGRQSATRVSLFPVRAAPLPALSIGDVSAPEGNRGTTTFSFPVTLSTPGTRIVSVDYATSDGTATAASDYVTATGTLTIGIGDDTAAIAVSVVGDPTTEPNETFTVTLSNARNATLARATATGTIVDDELVLLAPTMATPVPQNVPIAGCAAHATRGYGISITFRWQTEHHDDISGFMLRAFHEGATLAIVSVYVAGPDARSYTTQSCNAFVVDTNLTGWHWTLTATDSQLNPVVWAQTTFAFAPCRLADGSACYAAP